MNQQNRINLRELKGKIYLVTDTSWWLDNGWKEAEEIVKKYPDVLFVIPGGVMKELDGLKKNQDKREKVYKSLKQIQKLVDLGNAEIIFTEGKYYNALASKVDEEVVRTAERLKKEKKQVFLMSIDENQIMIAKKIGIERVSYGIISEYIIKTKKNIFMGIFIIAIFTTIMSIGGYFFLTLVGLNLKPAIILSVFAFAPIGYILGLRIWCGDVIYVEEFGLSKENKIQEIQKVEEEINPFDMSFKNNKWNKEEESIFTDISYHWLEGNIYD